jgi:hypothetical protein
MDNLILEAVIVAAGLCLGASAIAEAVRHCGFLIADAIANPDDVEHLREELY